MPECILHHFPGSTTLLASHFNICGACSIFPVLFHFSGDWLNSTVAETMAMALLPHLHFSHSPTINHKEGCTLVFLPPS